MIFAKLRQCFSMGSSIACLILHWTLIDDSLYTTTATTPARYFLIRLTVNVRSLAQHLQSRNLYSRNKKQPLPALRISFHINYDSIISISFKPETSQFFRWKKD